MSAGLIIQIIAILVGISCSTLGVFLVLKNMSMLTDAITHTVLLGIVISFFIVRDLSSPFLVLGASIFGLITVFLVEGLINTRLVKEDSAIGIIMSFLFSLAVILISKYAANIHLDVDAVLLGEIAFAPFHKITLFNRAIPKSILESSIILILNITFVVIFFKELKISIFDRNLAITLGMLPTLIHYLLMALVSITAVISFESVGAILLISFMIGPALSSYLLSKNLKSMIIISYIYSTICSLIGYKIAMILDVSIAGSIAVTIGFAFVLTLIYKNVVLERK